MHHIAQLGECGVTTHQYAYLLNDVGSMSAKGMTTKNATFRISKELQQSFRLVQSSLRPTQAASGSVKIAAGMMSKRMPSFLPTIWLTTRKACISAACASI